MNPERTPEPQADTQDAGGFAALLADLATLQAGQAEMAKALKSDAEDDQDGDDKIKRAAAEGGNDPDGDGDGQQDDDRGGDGDAADSEYFGKSFPVKMPDGTEVAAYDGTEAIMGLHRRMDAFGADVMKALSGVTAALKGFQEVMAQQGEMAKSLKADIATIRVAPGGRKTVLNVHEKPAPGGMEAAPAAPARGDVLAKAMTALQGGKINGADVAKIEASLNVGAPVPRELLVAIGL